MDDSELFANFKDAVLKYCNDNGSQVYDDKPPFNLVDYLDNNGPIIEDWSHNSTQPTNTQLKTYTVSQVINRSGLSEPITDIEDKTEGTRVSVIRNPTSTDTILDNDHIIMYDVDIDTTVTLPDNAEFAGRKLIFIFKVQSASETVTINRAGTDTINSSLTEYKLVNSGDKISLLSDGQGSWWIREDTALVGRVDTLESVSTGYPPSATDPTSPAPNNGDKYYNTILNQEMLYDGSRSKWLSVSTLFEGCGYGGKTKKGKYHKRFGDMKSGKGRGTYVPKSTITHISVNSETTSAHKLELLMDGKVILTFVNDSGSYRTTNDNVNVNMGPGNLAFKNAKTSVTVSDLQCSIQYKLRI